MFLLDGHDPAGLYGAKGIGEIGVVPAPAAVANAVAHATGVRVHEVPITPEKVLRHLRPDTTTARISRHRPVNGLAYLHLMWTDLIRKLYDHGLYRFLHRAGNGWKVEATCGLLHRALQRLARDADGVAD